MTGHASVQHFTYTAGRRGRYEVVDIRAGRKRVERVVPPAGEDNAFDLEVWDHTVQVSVSPTGRSVQVWVDGRKVSP